MCICMCLLVCSAPHVCSAHGGQKNASVLWSWNYIQRFVSHHAGAGNQTLLTPEPSPKSQFTSTFLPMILSDEPPRATKAQLPGELSTICIFSVSKADRGDTAAVCTEGALALMPSWVPTLCWWVGTERLGPCSLGTPWATMEVGGQRAAPWCLQHAKL